MKEINKIAEIDGDFIVEFVKAKGDVKWLKKVAEKNHSFIALRSAFINRYEEFAKFRKTTKIPLWQRISQLED